MHDLEDFLANLNKIEQLDDLSNGTQLIYIEKLNDFFLRNDNSWHLLNNLYKKKIKVSE